MGFSARRLSLHELTGGNPYVICDSRACMSMVWNQINYALGTRLVSLHLTNLVDLQAGKRGEGRIIWLEAKRRPLLDLALQRDRGGNAP